KIIGLDGVRDAYRTGRGAFRTRATARIENVTPRRKGIVITELPYTVGPEKVIEKIKEGVQSKKLSGISDALDLTDRTHGLRLVIEVKTGFNPDAVLEQLYRYTPLEDSFSINNVALVDGQPRTLGLRELLVVWVEHRIAVVRRRSTFRLAKRRERLHLVQGLLVAILDIDEVIQVIRSSDDSETARTRLRQVFDLSEPQAEYILELRLRRLTRFSRIELEKERDELAEQIAALEALLADEGLLRGAVSDEMAEVAATYGTPRRTILLESAGAAVTAAEGAPAPARGAKAPALSLEIEDAPCYALLSATGLLARTGSTDVPLRPAAGAGRARHDVLSGVVATSIRGEVGVLTSRGLVRRLSVLDLPALPPTDGAPTLSGGLPLGELLALEKGERVVGLTAITADAPTLAVGTAQGVVKRVISAEAPANRDSWEVIALKDGDEVVGGVQVTDDDELVLIASDAALLHFSAAAVRPQGRPAGGMAGIKLGAGARVVSFGALPASAVSDDGLAADDGTGPVVVTVAGSSDALPGTQPGTAKVTPFARFPGKGRATGGVRAHRFLKGEDALILAWVGPSPARATGSAGQPVELPEPDDRRDGSGQPLAAPAVAIG
ncbi:MAG TPA: DNA gyrase subunit A, partial [Cellulomonas sp.]